MLTSCNLVVLRVSDIECAHAFYHALGLEFEKHRHGVNGVAHYAATLDNLVFELYPTTGQSTADIRIGFSVDNMDSTLNAVSSFGGTIVTPAKQSPWGLRAVIRDPFGHAIEQ